MSGLNIWHNNRTQAREVGAAADGVVIGSAFIRLMGSNGDKEKVRTAVYELARSIKGRLV